MKKLVLLTLFPAFTIFNLNAQVVMNEVYTDPGAGKHEFFEMYNTSTSSLPQALNNFTIVTFYEFPGDRGFYVMDLPDIYINPRGFAVGSAASPFNYQGVSNSSSTLFSWNDPLLATQGGYVKKWSRKNVNSLDGNLSYDQEPLPADFNDFFFRRTGVGASYTVFLYKNGVLINALIFGSGGYPAVIPTIITMPPLFIDMSGADQDFTIDFSTYTNIPLELVGQDGGSDNGYIRERDGLCGGWDKSSAQVQHTPLVSNGVVDDTKGFLSVSTIIQTGNPIVGSDIIYDVVAGPASSFPVELQVFKDDGINGFLLDGQDSFVESNIETTVTDGPFTTNFQPYDMNMIVVVKANSGCIDKVIAVQNSLILPLKLMNYQGSLDKTNVSLAWTIGENQFADRFEVERSTNGKDFSSVGMVFASSLSGDEDYEFRDNMPSSGKAFYRLKMYDKSQKSEYSRTLLFQKEMKASALTIINNPATDKLSLSFNATSGNKAAISLYDLGGRKVMTREITVYEGTNSFSFSLPVSLQSGMYIAEVYTGTERITARFVKQ